MELVQYNFKKLKFKMKMNLKPKTWNFLNFKPLTLLSRNLDSRFASMLNTFEIVLHEIFKIKLLVRPHHNGRDKIINSCQR